ncbi:hypothetical protein [Methanobacterium sp.]|uniref:hypothetical protein n=1 Tax=Methanobacterium sp. TaxID=2164 RepID=UPI002ABCBFBB|nr:hypothetical protein [Methanobacterium sp.]MDY9924497.1 hypothetical protein [Methanobacterium sp.]
MSKGVDHITGKKEYICRVCEFQWQKEDQTYEKCPDCGSEEIIRVDSSQKDDKSIKKEDISIRRSYGGNGRGGGAPRVCKCPNCGYESPKTRGVPCRNQKCPKCDTPLCGAD